MTDPIALAQLRHLHQNMVNGAVRDTASAKRIAEGLLAPAIEALERATPPVVAGEPVAWRYVPSKVWGEFVYTEDPKRAQHARDNGIDVQPVFTTPQPTQAQAGAVPLTDEQLAEIMRETWGCASIAPRHAIGFARAIEAAHGIGIKGDQHG